MEMFAKRIVSYWVQIDLVEESQAEWYTYGLLKRVTTLCTFIVVISLGALHSNIWRALLFTSTLMYLRAATNGHHAKTYLRCLFNSCIIEIVCVLLCDYLIAILSIFLALVSAVIIFTIAPLNNEQIHFSDEELAAVRAICRKRLAISFILHLVLLPLYPVGAYCVSLAMSADAFLLLIAKNGITKYKDR